MKVQVELDQWDRRGEMHPALLADGSQVVIGLQTTRDGKIVFDRTIIFGEYCFRVFVEEYRGETFFLRVSMAVENNSRRRKGRRKLRTTALRERPIKPVYDGFGEVYWPLDRTGVFERYPALWDDYWASLFIKETLDGLRSPEIPKHYELHGDNSDQMD